MFWIASLSLLIFGLLDNVRGPFFSQTLTTLHLTDSQGALYFAGSSLSASFSSWSATKWLYRIGAKSILQWGLVGMSLGFIVFSMASQLYQLVLGSILFGIGMGLSSLGQNVGVSEAASDHNRRQRLAALHSMYGFASLLAPLVARLFLSREWNWQSAFLLLAALPMAMAVGGLLVRANPHGRSSMPVSLHNRDRVHFIFYGVAISAYLFAEISVATRLVLYVERITQLSPAEGTTFLAVFFLLFSLIRLVFSFYGGASGDQRGMMLASLVLTFFSLALGLTFSPWWLAVSGLTMGPFYPLAIAQARRIFGIKAAPAISYILGLGSMSVVVMHLLIGWLTDRFNLTVALMIGPLGILLAITLLVLEQRIFGTVPSKAHT